MGENYSAQSGRANDPSEDVSSTTKLGWYRGYRRYRCRDGTVLKVPRTIAIEYAKSKKSKPPNERLFVSIAWLNRDMREIIASAAAIRTITFPRTVRVVRQAAFFMDHELLSTVVNEGLEVLGTDEYTDDGNMRAGAFEDSGLKIIKLSSTLRRIEYSAFKNCKSLKNIQLPKKLEYIGIRCFSNSGLEEIELPRSLHMVHQDAFANCDRLKTIRVQDDCKATLSQAEIPETTVVRLVSTAMVGKQRVRDLRHLRQVVIPDGIEKIGNHWFWGCDVEEVTIPASVTEIGADAFCNCKKLAKVTFQRRGSLGKAVRKHLLGRAEESLLDGDSQLRLVGNGAFSACTCLKVVDLPDSVEEIGIDAFGGSGLENFTAPKALKTVHQGAFYKCENLKEVQLNEGLETLGTDERPDGMYLNGVFEGSGLESIKLPSTLRVIEYNAFMNCKDLKSVEFPDRLEKIEHKAFLGSGLESVKLPSTLKVVEINTFSECRDLKSVEFSEGLERIELGAFLESGLFSVTLPRSLRVLAQAAFAKCENLKTVVLNEGLETLGTDEYDTNGKNRHGAFGYSAVQNVYLPSTLKLIEYSAFEGCKDLSRLALPNRLEFIGKLCFYKSGIQRIDFPASLKTVGTYAFFGCTQLRDVRLNEGLVVLGEKGFINNKEMEGYAFTMSGIESIVFPSTLREIPEATCWACSNLKSATFREGLESIGIGAFQAAGIESAALPASLRKISQGVFYRCKSLRTAKFSEGLAALGTDEYDSDGDMLKGVFEGSALESVELPKTLKRIEYSAFKDCENLKDILLPEGLDYIGEKVFFNTMFADVTVPK